MDIHWGLIFQELVRENIIEINYYLQRRLCQFILFSAAKQTSTGKFGKIVGLDPALPLFKYDNVDDRLADADASYVEVIHTCAGFLGFSKPIGSSRWEIMSIS